MEINPYAPLTDMLPDLGLLLAVSSLLTIPIFIVIIFRAVRRWKVESAILESRNLLREINERQKQAEKPASSSLAAAETPRSSLDQQSPL